MPENEYDILTVGGGLSGSSLAKVMGRKRRSRVGTGARKRVQGSRARRSVGPLGRR
jgi:flavin-dependent dehydrogenase